MGNKGKTPRKSVFAMVDSQKGSYILQHYNKVIFMSPRKAGHCQLQAPGRTVNNGSELVSKCRHANKYSLNNYKAND